jgi:hypothetical protein
MVAWFVYGCPIFYHVISAIASALQLLKTLWASELHINSHKERRKMKVSNWDYFIVTTSSKRSNLKKKKDCPTKLHDCCCNCNKFVSNYYEWWCSCPRGSIHFYEALLSYQTTHGVCMKIWIWTWHYQIWSCNVILCNLVSLYWRKHVELSMTINFGLINLIPKVYDLF